MLMDTGYIIYEIIALIIYLYCAYCLQGIVDLNAVEKTWDCPCHGSRFDPHGRVI